MQKPQYNRMDLHDSLFTIRFVETDTDFFF